ncbi:MAG: glycosyltransferase [Lachnospiraceae bacterium]|nr:glycosyltransferase [Lachnospiraceae bacterium]
MFGYVVLHYQNIEVTKDCIDKLLLLSPEAQIVIVDNCSPNGSGKELEELYAKEPKVDVVLNDKNEGFARGNNLGYRYMKDHYEVDYMVVMNNDIIIEDKNFEKIISEFMEDNEVDVCGPDMVNRMGNHQNPLALSSFTDKFLKKRVIIDSAKCVAFKVTPIFNMYLKYKDKNKIPPRERQKTTFNCVLHGSCVVFSKKYVGKEKFAFIPVTYMYNEEYILFDYLQHKGYKTGYCDKATISHLEGMSTKTVTKNMKDKVVFRFKNNTISLKKQLEFRKKLKKSN